MPSQSQPMTPEDTFGVRMRREREQRGWSQAELAQRMADNGVELHVSAIAKMESVGGRAIRLNEAVAVANALDVDLGELVTVDSDDIVEALEKLQEALKLHRDARLLEKEAERITAAFGADFGSKGMSKLLHPAWSQPLRQALTALEEFGGERQEAP